MIGFFNSIPGAIDMGLVWAIMGIGLFISFKILDFADLTVDGSFAAGGCVCAALLVNGVNIFIAMLVAIAAGALCGLVTGIIHTYLGIPGVLAGILTQLMLWSINLKVMGRSNIPTASQNYFVIITQLHVMDTLWVLLGIIFGLIILLYWFFGTEYGASIRCTGSNKIMARANGINVKNRTVVGLMISNALVAFAGAMLCQFQGFADINMGRGAIVTGLAAIIVGVASMNGIVKLAEWVYNVALIPLYYSFVNLLYKMKIIKKQPIQNATHRTIPNNFAVMLLGVTLGAIIYYFIYNVIVFLSLDTDLLKLFAAVIVIVFLAAPYVKKTYFSRIKNAKKAAAN